MDLEGTLVVPDEPGITFWCLKVAVKLRSSAAARIRTAGFAGGGRQGDNVDTLSILIRLVLERPEVFLCCEQFSLVSDDDDCGQSHGGSFLWTARTELVQ